MRTEGLCVDCGEVDDSLVLLSNGSEIFSQRSTLFWGFGENVGKRDTSLCDGQSNVIEFGEKFLTFI